MRARSLESQKLTPLVKKRWGTERWLLLCAFLAMVGVASGCLARRFEQKTTGTISTKVPSLANAGLLDANDVSILVPLRLVTDGQNRLAASNFLRQEQFAQALANGQNQGPNELSQIDFRAVSQLDVWRVVSMRYDPCAPGAHAAVEFAKQKEGDPGAEAPGRDSFCKSQVRLVVQPFLRGGDQDFTMHLVFEQPKNAAALDRQVRGLLAIKKASEDAGASTTGRALAIHPGLDSPNNTAVVTAFLDFLKETCDPMRLSSIAVMGLAGGGPEPWTFYANLVRGGQVPQGAAPIPTVDNPSGGAAQFQAVAFVGPQRVLGLPSNTTTFRFVQEEDLGRTPQLVELTRDPILSRSTTTILNSGRTEPATNPEGGRTQVFDDQSIMPLDQKKLELLHAVDNPDRNHFFSLDCVSCHTSANLMLRRHDVIVENPSLAGAGELAAIRSGNPGRFVTPKGTTAYVSRTARQDQALFGRPWSLRNFGYFEGKASIAFRTATETGEVLREIHEEMMQSPKLGPNACAGVSDEEWLQKDAELWTCIQFDADSDARCLARICGGESPEAPQAEPPFGLLRQKGSELVMRHGPRNQFIANLQVIDLLPLPRFLPSGFVPNVKFAVTHSPTDRSNLILKVSDDGKTLSGFRYNMGFTDKQHTASLTWDPEQVAWTGTFAFPGGSSEPLRIEVASP